MEIHTSGSGPPVAHTSVNHVKGLKTSWGKCCEENILLTLSKFSFPSMTFPNMPPIWFCGYISKNIPPYRMLQCKDVKQVKGGKQNLSNMKTLVKHAMRAVIIVNQNDLVVTCWSPRKAMDLYGGVRHFISFPCLAYYKRRRCDTIS